MIKMLYLTIIIILLYLTFIESKQGLNALTRKRIYAELSEIISQNITLNVPFNTSKDECGIRLSPLRTNLLEWHFSFTGIEDTIYSEGIYHGYVVLPQEYPKKPPHVAILTPNGRWEVNKFICLSASGYHEESWNSDWNLRTLILSLRSFMLSSPNEIGGINTSPENRLCLAKLSRSFLCPRCGVMHYNLDLYNTMNLNSGLVIKRCLVGNKKVEKSSNNEKYNIIKSNASTQSLKNQNLNNNIFSISNSSVQKIKYLLLTAAIMMIFLHFS